jgi:hypothetical protein
LPHFRRFHGAKPPTQTEKGDRIRAGVSEVIDEGRTVIVLFSAVNPQSRAIEIMPPQVQLAGKARKGALIRKDQWTTSEQLPFLTFAFRGGDSAPASAWMGSWCSPGPALSRGTKACFCNWPKAARWINPHWHRSALGFLQSERRFVMTEERHPSQDWNEEERTESEVVEEQSERNVHDDRPEELDSPDEAASQESFFDRVRARFTAPASRDSKSTERTRGLVVLVGASVACLFLFVGMFTTDADTSKKPRGTGPNLGRPAMETTNQENGNRSPDTS